MIAAVKHWDESGGWADSVSLSVMEPDGVADGVPYHLVEPRFLGEAVSEFLFGPDCDGRDVLESIGMREVGGDDRCRWWAFA